MPFGNLIARATGTLVDRVLCVAGAVAFSQGPEFIQQYRQRLGGHLAEARRHLDAFEETARKAGESLPEFIQHTAANSDPAVARLSIVMNDAAARVESLQFAHDRLVDTTLWSRPFVFLRHLDRTIAEGTWAAYRPAVPTTLEGLVYAAAGMAFFLLAFQLAAYLVGCWWRSRAHARPRPA